MNYSLQRLLVIIGLITIPFYELIFKIFPFVKVIAPDTRVTKELLTIMFALAIGLLAIFQGTLKPFNNKFLLVIPIYLLFSLFMSPQVDLFINNVSCGDLYFWKPFVQILCLTLMVVAIASMDIDFDTVIKTMVVCGAVMAGYVILQKFGFDQFFVQREGEQFQSVTSRELGGSLGNPTIVASFLAMIFPLAFYLKRYWLAAITVIAILFTKSEVALISLILISVIYLINLKRIPMIAIVIALIVSMLAFGYSFFNNPKFYNFVVQHSSGRTEVWKKTYSDIRDGAIIDSKQDFSATGIGLGRFAFIFPDKHNSIFQQAHCDPLEFVYNCGFIGLAILTMGLWYMFSVGVLNQLSPLNFSVGLSFTAILFCSLGSFPFQLGAQQFYSAVLVGLLHNRSITKVAI